MPPNNAPHLVAPGDRFDRLTVIEFSHNDKRHRRHYTVKCDCGKTKTVQGTLLRSGNTRSCGCLSNEARRRTLLPNDRGVINHIILQYKRHAADRGLKFMLDYEAVEELVRAPCAYCGIVGGNLKRTKNLKGGFAYNGIDRLDSDKDYTPGNVAPCCGVCNRAKRDMNRDEFVAWVLRVAKHQYAMAEQWGRQATNHQHFNAGRPNPHPRKIGLTAGTSSNLLFGTAFSIPC